MRAPDRRGKSCRRANPHSVRPAKAQHRVRVDELNVEATSNTPSVSTMRRCRAPRNYRRAGPRPRQVNRLPGVRRPAGHPCCGDRDPNPGPRTSGPCCARLCVGRDLRAAASCVCSNGRGTSFVIARGRESPVGRAGFTPNGSPMPSPAAAAPHAGRIRIGSRRSACRKTAGTPGRRCRSGGRGRPRRAACPSPG